MGHFSVVSNLHCETSAKLQGMHFLASKKISATPHWLLSRKWARNKIACFELKKAIKLEEIDCKTSIRHAVNELFNEEKCRLRFFCLDDNQVVYEEDDDQEESKENPEIDDHEVKDEVEFFFEDSPTPKMKGYVSQIQKFK